MTIAVGPFKQLAIKKETVWGTLAGASGSQFIRRKTAALDEVRSTFGSDEVRTDQQRGTYVHGGRHTEGNITGDLSGGTYQMLMQSHMRRDMTAVTALTGMSITIAGAGPTYTVTRAAGDFLAGGIKQGMVVQLTMGSFNALNINKNLWVVSATATVLTVIPWGNQQMFAEGPIASATLTVPGKITYIPASGHTNDSYTMEIRQTDIAQYEVHSGCRISTMDLNLQPGGIAEVQFGVLGRGYGQAPGGTPYFTSPTAAGNAAGVSAVNGVLRAAGGQLAVVTGLSIKSNGSMTTGDVVGSNYTPDVFAGPIIVNGQLTAYFDSATIRDAFYNESIVSLAVVMYAGTTANAASLSFVVPAIKFGAAQKSDGPGPVILTCPFEAIVNSAGGAGTDTEATSLWVHDSLAT